MFRARRRAGASGSAEGKEYEPVDSAASSWRAERGRRREKQYKQKETQFRRANRRRNEKRKIAVRWGKWREKATGRDSEIWSLEWRPQAGAIP